MKGLKNVMGDLKIMKDEDFLAVQSILKKYNMSYQDFYCYAEGFASSISTVRQVRFSQEEYNLIKRISDHFAISFNSFVNICLRDYLDGHNDIIKKKELLLFLKQNEKKVRVNIDMNNIIFAKRLCDLAVYYGVPLPGMIRFIVFKYIWDNFDISIDTNGRIIGIEYQEITLN